MGSSRAIETRGLVPAQKLPVVHIGGSLRIPRDALDHWIREQIDGVATMETHRRRLILRAHGCATPSKRQRRSRALDSARVDATMLTPIFDSIEGSAFR